MREGPVGFGHLLQVLAPLHRRADAVARVEQFGGKALGLFLFARPSGLPLRKASLLALTLMPMSGVSMVIAHDTARLFPELGAFLAAIVLALRDQRLPPTLHLDNPDRDPRGWTMSVGHVVPVPFYAALKAVGENPMSRDLAIVTDRRIEFRTPQQALPMEQQKVINFAVDYLRTRYASRPDPKGFLGPTFTLSELYEVHSAILGENYWSRDAMRRNFVPFLEDTGELSKGSVGKPAALYRHRARDPLTTPRRVQRPSSSQIASEL